MRGKAIYLIGLFLIGSWSGSAEAVKEEMREAEVLGVTAERPPGQPYLLLREKGGEGIMEIFIGAFEAQAIVAALNKEVRPRPLTYDLMISVLRALKAEIKGIFILDLRENIYYAALRLQTREGELSFDSRPSDAIALALRAGAPIWVNARLLKEPLSEFRSLIQPLIQSPRGEASLY